MRELRPVRLVLLVFVAALASGSFLACSSAGSERGGAATATDGTWLFELDSEQRVLLTVDGDTIRHDEMVSTVQFFGKRGTISPSGDALVVTWEQGLLPREDTQSDSYIPAWIPIAEFDLIVDAYELPQRYKYPTEEPITWTQLDENTIIAGPTGKEMAATRFRLTMPEELKGSWIDGTGYKQLYLSDGFAFSDVEDPNGYLTGKCHADQGYLCLHIESKAGNNDGVECDFYYLSAYTLSGEGDETELVIDLFSGTFENPSSAPTTFYREICDGPCLPPMM
ncbi:MAG: hypothetical protein ACOCW6_01995 [Spirochaetota bacterium]